MHFSSGTAFTDGRLLAAAGDEVDPDLAAAADAAIVSDDEAVFTADDDVLLCTVVVEEDMDVLDVIDVFLTATSVLFELIVVRSHRHRCHSLQFSP